MNKFDVAANIAAFLLERTDSVLGEWKGRLTAKEQREMFGMFLGKGAIRINGEKETIEHVVKRCFGLDYEVTFQSTFSTIDKSSDERFDAFSRAEAS